MAKKSGYVNMSPDPNRAPGGARQLSATHADSKKYLWAGRILHVDTETMCCSISCATASGDFHDVPLPASGGGGPRSFSGTIPEPGTPVILGWAQTGSRTHKPIIVEMMNVGVSSAREFEPFKTMSPEYAAEALDQIPDLADDPHYRFDTVRLKLRKAYPGDFLASSSGGADILLDRDVNLVNRAGNEFKLRDSDQTAVLQSLNEFTSNAAGYYRRGLIKRNAFTFLQDLFPLTDKTSGDAPYDVEQSDLFEQTIPQDSPAFTILRDFGLIDENGKRTFDISQGVSEYPYIVTSDGQRINYITTGESENGFDSWPFAYVEDRKELRHISNGIMAVTEEGDGFQVDLEREVFIEDVHGTVVGNDFSSDAGRTVYKRLLKMKVFSDAEQSEPSFGPIFEALDNVQDQHLLDSKALARLYRIQAPESSNQYAFGIDKEGRTFIHIPASQTGEVDEKGKSLDVNIVGLVKAIIGKDPNTQLSADIVMNGGLKVDIGRGPSGSSIDLTLRGPIKRTIIGDNFTDGTPTEEVNIGGSGSRTVAGSDFTFVRGSAVKVSGAGDTTEADSITHNAGAGGYKLLAAGDHGVTVLGKSMEMYAQPQMTNYLLGTVKMSLAGVDATTIVAGLITRTSVTGGINDTVTAGNIAGTVAAGSYLANVGTGAFSVTVGSGALALTASAGPVSITSSLVTTITSGVSTVINSPVNKIGVAVAGNAVAGIPGPPGPHLDYLTGIPILGIPTLTIG